jgi:hypothetical protein
MIGAFLDEMRAASYPGTTLMRPPKGLRLRRGWILSNAAGFDPEGVAASKSVFLDDTGHLWSWVAAPRTEDQPYLGKLDRPLVGFRPDEGSVGYDSAFADLASLKGALAELLVTHRSA